MTTVLITIGIIVMCVLIAKGMALLSPLLVAGVIWLLVRKFALKANAQEGARVFDGIVGFLIYLAMCFAIVVFFCL
jgi:hypothetical protein